jgi:T5SS/PEP-CTERM-associated repeat protein/VCBS repeat-containing protein
VIVEPGGSLSVGNWTEIGENAGSDGRVILRGGGARLDVGGGWMDIGERGRGTLYVGPGAVASIDSGIGLLHNLTGGRIAGSGTARATVINYGEIAPGGSIGVLTIDGRLEQPAQSGGTLTFDIGGTFRGVSYDGIDVNGRVDLPGGKVVLNFVNNFAPGPDQAFTLIHADTQIDPNVTRNVEVRGLAPGFDYSLEVRGSNLVLIPRNHGVPAPVDTRRSGVLANDTDADGDALTAVLVQRPQHGTVTLYRDGSFTYVPDSTFAGSDSFAYRADDGIFTSAPTTVRVSNLPPAARDDAYAVDEDATLTVPAATGVLANDSDTVSPSLTASLMEAPRHGALTLNPDGSFIYTPAENFAGTDSFTYRANDGQLASAPATVTLAVRAVNDNPVAAPDRVSVRQNRELVIPAADLLTNDTDVDGDALRVTAVAATADTHGTVRLSDGRITYRPDRRYTGPASFTYSVSDGRGGTATGTVHVTVLPRHRGTVGAATGAGTLGGGRKQFAFAIAASGSGEDFAIRGLLTFRDLARKLVLRSGDIDLFEIGSNGKTLAVAGAASVNGREGYRFEVTAEDKSRSGSNDRFRIRVSGPDGFTYDSGGGDRIARGNVVIVTSRRERDE